MKLFQIKADKQTIFKKRLNKFAGITRENELVHIHDSGRLEKIIYEGNEILLRKAYGERKTKWDLIAGKYKDKWVLTNSLFHSKIAEKMLQLGIPFKANKIEKEKKYGNSRIDFLIDEKILMEVKGCTLEENEIAMFPDAPTIRGQRHIRELIHAIKNGYDAALLFLIFVPSLCFKPNEKIDGKFAFLFYKAISTGMKVYPALMEYDKEWIYYRNMLPLCNSYKNV